MLHYGKAEAHGTYFTYPVGWIMDLLQPTKLNKYPFETLFISLQAEPFLNEHSYPFSLVSQHLYSARPEPSTINNNNFHFATTYIASNGQILQPRGR